jgi:hypothetical protein
VYEVQIGAGGQNLFSLSTKILRVHFQQRVRIFVLESPLLPFPPAAFYG